MSKKHSEQINLTKILIACIQQSTAQVKLSSAINFEELEAFLSQLFQQHHPAQTTSKQEVEAQLVRLHQILPADLARIDLVLGGATKIKEYVFESPRLSEVRGASALLDWVNETALRQLWDMLSLPNQQVGSELILYAGGGGMLAFAPFGEGQKLADQLERLYTKHTLNANSVAVAESFHLLELRYGRLNFSQPNQLGYWIEHFERDLQSDDHVKKQLEAYYYGKDGESASERFLRRKSFGELVTLLATKQNRRRDQLHQLQGQSRWMPLYQLNPWNQVCHSSGNRPATMERQPNPNARVHYLSDASARKQYVGELLKHDHTDWKGQKAWFSDEHHQAWSQKIEGLRESSWERSWEKALAEDEKLSDTTYAKALQALEDKKVGSASDVGEIAQASRPGHYIGLIYADGNNVGRLMATLKTPQSYATVSRILSKVARDAVFAALAKTLKPVEVSTDERGADGNAKRAWVHPFEILTIGGDDLLLIVPGSFALEIALEIGKGFEQGIADHFADSGEDVEILAPIKSELGYSQLHSPQAHCSTTRYQAKSEYASYSHPLTIGLSAGVVVAQETTPIFFLRDLVEELLKSAKKKAAKQADQGFLGGAVDFMILKSVSMVTDKIESFRYQALGDRSSKPKEAMRKLFAKPYSWHEFEGLIKTAQAFHAGQFPRSQLYQISERLQRDEGMGVVGSVMDYLYSRSRASEPISDLLQSSFEQAWRSQVAGKVALPPWLAFQDQSDSALQEQRWETIWPDLVEIYDMLSKPEQQRTDPAGGAA